MLEIVKRPRAKEDLKGIWRYSFDEWNEAQADKYLSEIEAGIEKLRHNPKLGRPREEVRTGYRSLRGCLGLAGVLRPALLLRKHLQNCTQPELFTFDNEIPF